MVADEGGFLSPGLPPRGPVEAVHGEGRGGGEQGAGALGRGGGRPGGTAARVGVLQSRSQS